jgi:hypothetical protein
VQREAGQERDAGETAEAPELAAVGRDAEQAIDGVDEHDPGAQQDQAEHGEREDLCKLAAREPHRLAYAA